MQTGCDLQSSQVEFGHFVLRIGLPVGRFVRVVFSDLLGKCLANVAFIVLGNCPLLWERHDMIWVMLIVSLVHS